MKINLLLTILAVICITSAGFASPYAVEVTDFTQGPGATPGYDNASVVLGAPPAADSYGFGINIDYGPWEAADVLSLGNGGTITIKFDHAVLNNSSDVEYGIDLLVFGNGFFTTDWYGDGSIEGTASFEPATIEVSQDGITFYEIAGVYADDMYPYTAANGNFVHATPAGINYMGQMPSSVLTDYAGGCGGAQVNLDDVIGYDGTLEWVQYVRVTDIAGDSGISDIVAFADVIPEPATGLILLAGAFVLRRKHNRS